MTEIWARGRNMIISCNPFFSLKCPPGFPLMLGWHSTNNHRSKTSRDVKDINHDIDVLSKRILKATYNMSIPSMMTATSSAGDKARKMTASPNIEGGVMKSPTSPPAGVEARFVEKRKGEACYDCRLGSGHCLLNDDTMEEYKQWAEDFLEHLDESIPPERKNKMVRYHLYRRFACDFMSSVCDPLTMHRGDAQDTVALPKKELHRFQGC